MNISFLKIFVSFNFIFNMHRDFKCLYVKSVDLFLCDFFSVEKSPSLGLRKPTAGSDQVLINAVKRIVYLPVSRVWNHLFV